MKTSPEFVRDSNVAAGVPVEYAQRWATGEHWAINALKKGGFDYARSKGRRALLQGDPLVLPSWAVDPWGTEMAAYDAYLDRRAAGWRGYDCDGTAVDLS